MYSSKLAAFAIALGLPLVQGQAISLNNLPQCAQGAVISGLASTKCEITNIACICSAVEFVTSITSLVQQSCSMADQQVTLTFAQSLCSRVGVTLNVPAVAAAANTPSSPPASPAPAASSAPAPSSAAATTPENVADEEDLPATDPSTTSGAAAASSSEPVSTAPVSPSAFPTSSAFLDEGDRSAPGDAATGPPSLSAPFSTTSSALVFDTNSVIPSATVASYPLSTSTDAFTADAQVPTTTSAYRNSSSTANTTVAASSPIPYVGAAVTGKVQGVGMMVVVVLGVFWGL